MLIKKDKKPAEYQDSEQRAWYFQCYHEKGIEGLKKYIGERLSYISEFIIEEPPLNYSFVIEEMKQLIEGLKHLQENTEAPETIEDLYEDDDPLVHTRNNYKR